MYVVYTGVMLPTGPRPAKRLSGQPNLYFGWPCWPSKILYKKNIENIAKTSSVIMTST